MRYLVAVLALAAFPALAQVHVDGYIRKDGTYVPPHYRSTPDSSRSNNWGSQGNVNPYTGQPGTVNPYAPPTYTPPSYYNPPSRSSGYR